MLDRLDDGDPPATRWPASSTTCSRSRPARLNLLLTDGARLAATRVGNSLFAARPVIVSEPLDDEPGWTDVPDRSLVGRSTDGAAPTITPL